jgi:RecA/RadA recombinase
MVDQINEEEIINDVTDIVDEDNVFAEPTPEELANVSKQLKVELSPGDKEKYTAAVPAPPKKKAGRPAAAKPGTVKKDIPTPTEVEQMTDEEIESGMDQKTKDLYMEFNSFLEDKTEITSDTGIKDTLPTGIDVADAVMGGGFAIGSMGVITGNPGSGKSMLGIQAMGAAQRKYNGNILVSMLDSEEATTTIRMSNLGVKNPKIKPYNDITVEKVFKFLEGMCLYKEMKDIIDTPSVVMWDSVANTLSQKEREAEDINSVIGYKGRLLSLLIPKYVSKLTKYNICLIAINQLRDVISIGNFAPAKELKYLSQGKTMPGGNAFKFNAFHLLEMKAKETATREKYGFDGYFAEVVCVKNKLFPPNIKISIAGNFVTGFSNFWTNFRFLTENKRMVTGAWNYLADLPTVKLRTKDAEETYNTNPLFKEAYDKAVKETIQTEIIEKHNLIL